MTVSSSTNIVQYNGNGSTTAWPVPFRFFKNTDLVAVKRTVTDSTVTLTLNVDYSVAGANSPTGGTLTTTHPLATGELLTIARILPLQQTTDLRNQGMYFAEVHEDVFDYLTMLIQQVSEGDARALKHPRDKEHYEAEGRRIVDLEDPVEAQDAATQGWASRYFSSLIDSVSGSINTTNGIAYESGTLYDFLKLGVNRSVDTIAALRQLVGTRNQRALVNGYYSKGDGGGGLYYLDPADTTSTDNGGSVIVSADGSRWKLALSGLVNAKQFGLREGTSDAISSANGIALQNALDTYKAVTLPDGTFYYPGNLTISKDGAKLIGSGKTSTRLVVSSANKTAIKIAGSLNNVEIGNFTLDRSIVATDGGNGIDCSTVTIGQATIRDMVIQKQYNGLALGPTDYSVVRDCIVQRNQNVGVYMTNTPTDGACQWSMDHVLSQLNGAQGLLFKSIAGPAQVTLGTWVWVDTYANNGVGIGLVGSAAVPVHGARLLGGFIGEDGASEIYLDTYGGNHTLRGLFVELPGQSPTGPTSSVAASKTGSGIEVTANNIDVSITSSHVTNCAHDGISIGAQSAVISGCRIKNCGLSATSGRQSGINVTAGRVIINGGASGNLGANASQRYGVYAFDGNVVSITCMDLSNNSTAPFAAAANQGYASLLGNLPNTLVTQMAGQAGVIVGGAATGAIPSPGVINVAGGITKNGTAYTNP